MAQLIDPLKRIARKVRQPTSTIGLSYEVDLTPPAGARLVKTTVQGQHGQIPVLYDTKTRITYPVPA